MVVLFPNMDDLSLIFDIELNQLMVRRLYHFQARMIASLIGTTTVEQGCMFHFRTHMVISCMHDFLISKQMKLYRFLTICNCIIS